VTVTIEIVGAPVACGDGVGNAWREIASWAERELKRSFGDAVHVRYHDLFDAGCPRLPQGAALPVVLIDGEPITVGKKISLPAIRKAVALRGVTEAREGRAGA
jgi:hypothetical protein